VESSGRNTPRLRQMLGVYKHNICRMKELRNDFLFSMIDNLDTSLLRDLFSGFCSGELLSVFKERGKKKATTKTPSLVLSSFFLHIFTYLLIRKI